jgi:branched-chain amino acid transport system ATP-binding protein
VTPLLDVRDVALRFGGIVALDGVSFDLEEGQILGLIGPNGAGKTTLFNCLSRLYAPNRGDILFKGRSLLDRPPHRIAEIGIARTFQNLALFPAQSVFDNVRIGGHARCRSDFVSDTLHLPWVRREEKTLEETAWGFLDMLGLREVAHQTPDGYRSAPVSAWNWLEPSQRARNCYCSTSRQEDSTMTKSPSSAR